MNKTTKVLSLAVAMFAIAGMTGVFSGEAFANPKGVPNDLKKDFSFQYIAIPEGTIPSCGNGKVIYTERGNSHDHIDFILQTEHKNHIEDCTSSSVEAPRATVHIDTADKYFVYVRLLGPPTADNKLDICAELKAHHDADNELSHLCLLGNISLDRSQSKNFKNVLSEDGLNINLKKRFADSLDDVTFSLDKGTGFKHAQFFLFQLKGRFFL